LDSLSDFFSIHLNAVVERDVSHTNDVGPRDIGMSLLKRRRDISRGFADDVELASNGILDQMARFKVIECSACYAGVRFDGLLNQRTKGSGTDKHERRTGRIGHRLRARSGSHSSAAAGSRQSGR
jgi:hypothetical protein